MSGVKIGIIGAGSGAFSLGLVRDICLTPRLAGSTVCFMDIDEGRLNAIHNLCARYAQEMGAELRLEKTLVRREALDGSDFVINTALTASHDRLREGWDVARRHGYRFGGSYHVMYDEAFWINYSQFRFFEEITEDILDICPKAWHLLVANPVISGITHLTRKYPEAKVVGLCHGYAGIYDVANVLGLDRNRITYEIPGVNHHVWLTHFYHAGENGFNRLDEWIERESAAYWAAGQGGALSQKRVDLYRQYGALPIGDTASWSGASWPWWYHSNDEVEARFAEVPVEGWLNYFRHVSENAAEIAKVAADTSVRVTEKFPPTQTDELMIPLVESIACDIPRVFVVNIANTAEFVPGIPRDFEVEIPALASKRGIEGIRTQGLPKPIIAQILRDRVAPIEIELEAYRTGRRALLRELVLTDKWTRSAEGADAFIEDIIALPYHEEMKKHYR